MGGVDKGLELHLGQPLARHALDRLRPQVGSLMLSANRHLDTYGAMGVPVWPDVQGDYAGPLAGMLAGLSRCTTHWMVTVPCDTPGFPEDLVGRLAAAVAHEGAELALAATREPDGSLQPHPVFCLMQASLRESLEAFLSQGQRRIDRWTGRHRQVTVVFEDLDAFFNANTPEELQRLQPQALNGGAAP